jgi:RNA polymerase sigma factor (sigma-70 family)
VSDQESLAEPFEHNRAHLRAVALRMLGSSAEAEDAVQEAWLRLSRADTTEVTNLRGWLTTVVARVCLDMLRSRKARGEQELATAPQLAAAGTPEHDRGLADAVGLAVLVVLEKLEPAERLAFVLHDMFAMSFEEIAPVVGRSPVAARQLASRARRRVQGGPPIPEADLQRQRSVVDAFLAALRGGDFEAIVAVLDPDVRVRMDDTHEMRGATTWAKGAVEFSRMASAVRPALIDGEPGLALAPHGVVKRILRIVLDGDRIADVDIITDLARIAAHTVELG